MQWRHDTTRLRDDTTLPSRAVRASDLLHSLTDQQLFELRAGLHPAQITTKMLLPRLAVRCEGRAAWPIFSLATRAPIANGRTGSAISSNPSATHHISTTGKSPVVAISQRGWRSGIKLPTKCYALSPARISRRSLIRLGNVARRYGLLRLIGPTLCSRSSLNRARHLLSLLI